MPTAKLTKRAVDSIQPKGKPTYWYDTDVKGFGLKVMPSGTKTWIVEYRPGAGGRSPEEAADAWQAWYADTRRSASARQRDARQGPGGDDPAARKEETRAAITVPNSATSTFAKPSRETSSAGVGRPRRRRRLSTDRGRIERHIKPLLGRKAARDVTRGDIERFLRDVAGGKTAADVKTTKHGRAV